MKHNTRCDWVNDNPIYIDYHDHEWGTPLHDDQHLFEMLILESMQAGLNWLTILKKRDAFRLAFDGFDPKLVAKYDEPRIQTLLNNAGIIRHRGKIQATIGNAQVFLAIQTEFGSFDHYLWSFVDGKPIQPYFQTATEVPANTPVSDALSKDLKKRGMKFVGSTICYAYMQAVGMTQDHTADCFRATTE